MPVLVHQNSNCKEEDKVINNYNGIRPHVQVYNIKLKKKPHRHRHYSENL